MKNINLGPQELELTQNLRATIITQIKANHGQIPVSSYIQSALYDPLYGYYNNQLPKFGKKGDFITAPLVSELFALCLVRQIVELWEQCLIARNILEIGAGNGQLMVDLLLNLGNLVDNYYVVELSPAMVAIQKQIVYEKCPDLFYKVIWLPTLPDKFNGVIVANEVLDAQPCEVILWDKCGIYQQMVSLDQDDNFIYVPQLIESLELITLAQAIKIENTPYISEINLNNYQFIQNLAGILTTGCILLIDYGYSASEYYSLNRYRGTLRGFFRQHQLDDILVYPGLIDITSNVNFSAIAVNAIENELDLIGYTTQANFLLNCGLAQIVTKKRELVNGLEYLKLTNQVNHLTLPNEMGEIFKVIGFSKNIEFNDWLGFEQHDLTYTL
ncbi:MAG: SAM-dependent methyltransferase [Burkholderiales bacterium]|nr:SAM-dependent methyltransferase [Burkholderiales bacterium]